MDELQVVVNEVRTDVKDLVKQSIIHNELLRTHETRSLALQSQQEKIEIQLEPIKQHISLMNGLGKAIGAIALGVLIEWAVKWALYS